MDALTDPEAEDPLEPTPCPCLEFNGPAGCPACGGRGVLTDADAKRFLGQYRIPCAWCTGGQASRRDDPERRFPCPACLGSRGMSIRNLEPARVAWMQGRIQLPGAGRVSLAIEWGDFSGADLSGLEFTNGWFSSCSFTGANFAGATFGDDFWFEHCDFTGSSIDLAEPGQAVFASSKFTPATRGALLAHGAKIEDWGAGGSPPGTEMCVYCEGNGCSECDDLGWVTQEEFTGLLDNELGYRRVPCLACRGEGYTDGAGPVSWACTKCLQTKWMNADNLGDFEIDEADLPNHPFESLDLEESSVRGCEIPPAKFVECNFTGTDFEDADLSGSTFISCDFSRTNLELAASLNGVRLYVDGLTLEQQAACIAKGVVILEEEEVGEE
jgi:uncharacterized protein YjbI with pentapeptide repeats